ncbi:hypothetical protein [Herbidospora mongoliensis]|uniref:hypothetical protein n=1 Tax=Herbidospora mongoliensis TaxID=688067 RepID=UPI00082B53C5|nr:hypothetical protein [Herbidospora mongoliensis]
MTEESPEIQALRAADREINAILVALWTTVVFSPFLAVLAVSFYVTHGLGWGSGLVAGVVVVGVAVLLMRDVNPELWDAKGSIKSQLPAEPLPTYHGQECLVCREWTTRPHYHPGHY